MLVSLRVRDLAVLEDVGVTFGPGLSVLTGETGAGKSLVVDALALLSGERADASLVRSGAERAVVEGVFETTDAGVREALLGAGLLEGSEGASPETFACEVVVRREIANSGKGRLFVNGSPAAVKTLAEIAPRLLVLYGQAEARELLDPSVPRRVLDDFGRLGPLAEETAERFREWRALEEERQRIAGASGDRASRLQLLEFQIAEIDAVGPKALEEEALAQEKAFLSSVEKRGKLLAEATAALDSEEGGALTALAVSRKAFAALAELDTAQAFRVSELADVYERVSDIAASSARLLERLQADPHRLAEVAERLDALARLKRRHGPALDDVLRYREAIGKERDDLVDLDGALNRAAKRAAAAFETYREAALRLSTRRREVAPRLSSAVGTHLRDLAFLKASFEVDVGRRADHESPFALEGEMVACSVHGIDQVVFAFSANPGEPARPLAKIASGGELSRVELALAAALLDDEAPQATPAPSAPNRVRKTDPPAKATGKSGTSAARVEASPRAARPARTLVFDEVDAGVSGATAEAVGRKLLSLAAVDQILVVTHLPQVAAAGQAHFDVRKEAIEGRTRTAVSSLNHAGRVEAIAAMIAGSSVGEAARQQAKLLLQGR